MTLHFFAVPTLEPGRADEQLPRRILARALRGAGWRPEDQAAIRSAGPFSLGGEHPVGPGAERAAMERPMNPRRDSAGVPP